MTRRRSLQRAYTVTYEKGGVALARYDLVAPTQNDAENQAGNLFYRQHPNISMFDDDPDLEMRLEEH